MWVVEWGILACVLVVPLALICGDARIPLGWRLIDCAFGVVGIVPLLLCRRYINALAQMRWRNALAQQQNETSAPGAAPPAQPVAS